MLVERVSGGSLHAYLHAKLLRPLGMTATRIGANQADIQPGHALFHEADGDGFRKVLHYRVSPVGGISVTTSLDVLLASRGYAESALDAGDKTGHFQGPDIYTTRSERDASGRVTALVLDATRVKGIRFRRQ